VKQVETPTNETPPVSKNGTENGTPIGKIKKPENGEGAAATRLGLEIIIGPDGTVYTSLKDALLGKAANEDNQTR